jgi:hypothetical protein
MGIGRWLQNSWGKVKQGASKAWNWTKNAVGKVAPFVSKIGGVVGPLLTKIPHPIAQGIGAALGVGSKVAEGVNGFMQKPSVAGAINTANQIPGGSRYTGKLQPYIDKGRDVLRSAVMPPGSGPQRKLL